MTSGKRNPDVRENPRVYSGSIKVVKQKLGSLMFFRRKKVNEVTCLMPLIHLQPCACKHLFDAKALEESAS
jgi:hypothetical protein